MGENISQKCTEECHMVSCVPQRNLRFKAEHRKKFKVEINKCI